MDNTMLVTMGETEYKIPTAYVDAQRKQGKEFSQIVNEYIAGQNLENHLRQASIPSSQAIDPGTNQLESRQVIPQINFEGADKQTGDWFINSEGERYQIPKAYVDQLSGEGKNRDQIAREAIQDFRQSLNATPPPQQRVQEPVPQQQRVQEPVPQQVATGFTKPNWINTASEWVGNNKVATGIGAAGTVGVLTLAGLAVQNAARQQEEQDEYERQLKYMTGWR